MEVLFGRGMRYRRAYPHGYRPAVWPTDWRSRNRTYTRENLDHTLAVSRFLIDLEIECRGRSDVSLIPFEDILAASPEATRKSRFPMSWSVPIQWHGGKAEVEITPDAIFGLRVVRADGSAARAYFFLEVDRGTMTIVPSERVRESDAFPYRATILRKLYAYADSYKLGLHHERFGIRAPRVFFVSTSVERIEKFRSVSTNLAPQEPTAWHFWLWSSRRTRRILDCPAWRSRLTACQLTKSANALLL
ncbi:MAG TPA: replication-relaxation family protein, partial [Steroidobacteraceae bacterium]